MISVKRSRTRAYRSRFGRYRSAIITTFSFAPRPWTIRWPARCLISSARILAEMNHPPYIGRLAPSPTGAQHIGNARTYLIAWLAARSRGGQVVLRIEDIDSPRIKTGAAQQACDDLHWFGL